MTAPVTKLILLAVVLLILPFQVTFLPYFKVFGIQPDLLFLIVFIASVKFNFGWAVVFALLGGVLKDAFSIYPFGINTALFCLWTLAVKELSRRISLDNRLIQIATVLVLNILHNILAGFLYFGSAKVFIPWAISLRIILFGALYTVFVLYLSGRLLEHIPD